MPFVAYRLHCVFAQDYEILKGCTTVPKLDDRKEFAEVCSSLSVCALFCFGLPCDLYLCALMTATIDACARRPWPGLALHSKRCCGRYWQAC